jgi:hypothetical protein
MNPTRKNSKSFFHDKQVYENQGYSQLTVYTKLQKQDYNNYMRQLYAAITARIGKSCFVILSRVCARGFTPKSHFRETDDNHRYRGASKLCCIQLRRPRRHLFCMSKKRVVRHNSRDYEEANQDG